MPAWLPNAILIALRAVLLTGTIVTAAAAATSAPCQPRDALTARLAARYGESLRARGVMTPVLLEIFANVRTGTFTILIVRPDGTACIAGAGDGWQEPDAGADQTRKSGFFASAGGCQGNGIDDSLPFTVYAGLCRDRGGAMARSGAVQPCVIEAAKCITQ